MASFGAEPAVDIVLEGEGGAVTLGGPLLEELARLVAATLEVEGRADAFPAALGPGFHVARYRILAVDGERPVVGRVEGNPPGGPAPGALPRLDVEEGGRVHLLGLPLAPAGEGAGAGAPRIGSRVWILGDLRGDTLAVRAYGVIRCRRDD